MTTDCRSEIRAYVQGLIDFAAWLNENETALDEAGFRLGSKHIYCSTPAEFAAAVGLLGGPTTIEYPDSSSRFVRVYRHFAPDLFVYAYTAAEEVCERVTTTETVETVEWMLRPILVTEEKQERGLALVAAQVGAVDREGRVAATGSADRAMAVREQSLTDGRLS